MGIVMKQSAANTVVTYFGFAIGAVNTMFLYTIFLGKEHYGMVTFLLSAATILMPVLAFGVHSTLIRFFSGYKKEAEREEFLSFMLVMPLLLIIPLLLGWIFGYDWMAQRLFARNAEIRPYLWVVPVIGLSMAYFEIFYAWAKVYMKSVFGNLINEVLVRLLIMAALFSIHFGLLQKSDFMLALTVIYALQLVAMLFFALSVKKPVLRFKVPANIRELVFYSFFIIVSGGIAVLLNELDKVIIGFYGLNESNAVYTIAIFIATVISVPSRSMLQIIYPMTAKLMAEKKYGELDALYKRSAITLQYFGGAIMLLIFVNLNQMFLLIPGHYESGTIAVFLIGLSKFCDVMLGNNNAIILNTPYYRSVLIFGILLVAMNVGLNLLFIPLYGIDGSAFATLAAVVVYNCIKLWFVVKKTGLYPFTTATLKSLGIVALLFGLFYFWELPFHPIVNIGLKSALVCCCYVFGNRWWRVSSDIDGFLDRFLLKLGIRP